MKNVVDVSWFSSGKRLEMRIFDGLIRLAGQIVECYGYGLKHAYIYALAEMQRQRSGELK